MTFTTPESTPLPASPLPPRAPAPVLAAALCFLLSLAMHLPWLGCTPIAGTEGHRIFPAHEMLRSHNWLVPMMFDKPFMTKPPLHHWLIAASEWLGTNNDHILTDPGPRDLFFWRLPSALMGAALCAAACLFGARWFGRRAGLISGLSAVGMIAIWGQSQVSDIDSTNTFAAALTALCGIELFVASPPRKWPWVALASLALGATLMTKGPAGLPIIMGVWIWAAVCAMREKRARCLAFPAYWLPLVLAAAIFVAYGLAAKESLHRHGLRVDLRGVQEGTKLLVGKSAGVFLQSLFVMLPQLIAFALPVSFALPFLLDRGVRDHIEPPARRIAIALAASVLIAWGICFISGMVNPRYGYPTLPPLCPLAGAVAVAAAKSRRAGAWLRGTAMASAIAMAAAAVGLAAASWPLTGLRPVLIACAALALAVLVATIARLRRSWNGAWGIVVLMMLASVPFGAQRHYARTYKDSGIFSAAKLKAMIGERSIVAVAGLVTSKPETLTYSNVRVRFYYPNDFVPKNVPGGTWVLLDQAERKFWLRTPGIRLEREQWFCRYGPTDYYLAWYGGIGW